MVSFSGWRARAVVELVAALVLALTAPASLACGGSGSATPKPGDPDDAGTVDAEQPTPGFDLCAELGCVSWCDAGVWDGAVPDVTTNVVVRAGMLVEVDCDATAKTLTIEAGGGVIASRSTSATLTLHGNLVVRGLLDYGAPATRVPAGVRAEIVFSGMDDTASIGTPSTEFGGVVYSPSALTPMTVVEGDIGLWVMGTGTFVAAGAEKKAWSFLTTSTGPEAATFTVTDASGWRAGDRLVLTPTAPRSETGALTQYDEVEIASVDGNTITVASAPTYLHAGCTDCMRRGEAINLSRNVVVRSKDDEAHAHIMVAESGTAQVDSVELRWLGPERCGGPARRAALYFHQQEDASAQSFVRHAAIWGGNKGGVFIERSHGIEVRDVAVYDSYDDAFSLGYDFSACGTLCTDMDTASPRDTVFTDSIAAKIGTALREDACLRISHRLAGFRLGGGEGTGAVGCVAVGVGVEGTGADVSGFHWPESGAGRPLGFVFERNVAHHGNAHGLFVWHNRTQPQAPYEDNVVFSNEKHGIHWGAYSNRYVLKNFTAVDNGLATIGVKAVPADDRARMDGGTVDDIRVLAYVFRQNTANILKDLTFTGNKPVGVTQLSEACTTGNPNDPDDTRCLRVWLRFENPTFPSGMTPFLFADSINRFAVWEVRGMSHPDYPELVNFDLYRRDNEVDGGAYHEAFDAWLVPR